MIDFSYSDLFYFALLFLILYGIFWLNTRDGRLDDRPEPHPTKDTTKTRVIE